MYRRSDK